MTTESNLKNWHVNVSNQARASALVKSGSADPILRLNTSVQVISSAVDVCDINLDDSPVTEDLAKKPECHTDGIHDM